MTVQMYIYILYIYHIGFPLQQSQISRSAKSNAQHVLCSSSKQKYHRISTAPLQQSQIPTSTKSKRTLCAEQLKQKIPRNLQSAFLCKKHEKKKKNFTQIANDAVHCSNTFPASACVAAPFHKNDGGQQNSERKPPGSGTALASFFVRPSPCSLLLFLEIRLAFIEGVHEKKEGNYCDWTCCCCCRQSR